MKNTQRPLKICKWLLSFTTKQMWGITCSGGWHILSERTRCQQRRWSCRFSARGSGSGTDMHGTCWDSWCRAEFSSSSLWPHIHDKTQETWDTIPRRTESERKTYCKLKAHKTTIHTALCIFYKPHCVTSPLQLVWLATWISSSKDLSNKLAWSLIYEDFI